jgi:hypothetical protein
MKPRNEGTALAICVRVREVRVYVCESVSASIYVREQDTLLHERVMLCMCVNYVQGGC